NTAAEPPVWCSTTPSATRSASSDTATSRAGSATDQPLHKVGITRAPHLDTRCGSTDLIEVLAAQLDLGRCQVFGQPVQAPSTGNRHDPRPLSQQPGQRDLAGGRALAGPDRLK